MRRAHLAVSTAIAVVAGSAFALLGASAANASPGDFTLSSTTVPAGGTVVISSVGWGDLSGETDPMTVINFETPAPPPSTQPGGGVGSGGDPGSAGGTSLVLKTIPASAGPWTYTLTIPANTPPGDGYNVCLSYQAYLSIGDGGCVALTVTAASSTSTPGVFTALPTARVFTGPATTTPRQVQIAGLGGVPTNATAVVVNTEVSAPTATGYVRVTPAGLNPSVAVQEFVKGQTISNLVVVKLVGGKIQVKLSAGSAQIFMDVSGWFSNTTPLTVTTTSLKNGVAGLLYQDALAATGGVPPYTWTATGVPAGLAVSTDGALTGSPTGTGTAQLRLSVTDATHTASASTVTLTVPTSVPPECSNQSCAVLTPDGQTVQIPATRIGAITLAPDGSPTQVLLTGPAPTTGQILVLAPTVDAPTGLIVVANTITPNPDGTSLVDVSPAGPADAYAEGIVQAVGAPVTSANMVTAPASQSAGNRISEATTAKSKAIQGPTTPSASASITAPNLTCDNNASSELHGLSINPKLTPTLAAIWKHPVFGGGGVYVGTGGLQLFQFDLDGEITVNLGVSVSGSANCHLALTPLTTTIPAGNFGAVIVQLDPSIDLSVSGKVDIRTSVTLRCGVEYRWSEGEQSRVAYCGHSVQPLQLNSSGGVAATALGTMAATVSLNGIAGITGSISASLHAAYTPAQHPIAEVDAKATFDLGACLVCLWSGSSAHVSIVQGTIFDKVLATYDTTPAAVPALTTPVITTASLPAATVGQPYAARLTTADNRNGTWDIVSGTLPDGAALSGDTISGKPTTQGMFTIGVSFTDTSGLVARRSYTLSVGSGGSPGGQGAIQNLDYCRQNVLDGNDDNSTDAVSLPFSLNFFGSMYSAMYISNNGYVRLDAPSGEYTPYPLADTSSAIIAPFFADVDTRNPSSDLVTYGASPDGKTFCVNWVSVGYYDSHVDKVNSFQLLLVDRQDIAAGDFDMVYNYGPLNWETGDASGGIGGIGGTAARAGYSAGLALPGTSYELPGSGVSGALVDGGTSPLGASSQGPNNSRGSYTFPIRH